MIDVAELETLFPFNTKLIMNIYSQVVKIWGEPNTEYILDIYDSSVQDLLSQLYYDISGEDVGVGAYHPWRLDELSREQIYQLGYHIGTKTTLETHELKDVLNTFQMFYVDQYGDIYNFPITGVW